MEQVTPEQVSTTAHLLGLETEKIQLCEQVVREEWKQFQDVNNEGGPADCQGNWPTFHQMRLAQFATWISAMLDEYLGWLETSARDGHNVLTEKYAWMMQSTDPGYYKENLESHLPALGENRVEVQEGIISVQLAWARDFMNAYPALGGQMRILTTSQDTRESTSFETYLRGELSSYSNHLIELYAAWVRDCEREALNITTETLENTVLLGGFANLDDAEEYLTR